MKELSKAYNPKEFENHIYQRWEQSGYFNPDNLPNAKKRKPFTISMPPPNITGELHLGHALGITVQDILIRYQRMRGRAALWVPGTDHAAIVTEILVRRDLQKQGVDPHQLGREKFLAKAWEWKKKYGRRIVEQVKRMGASADWSRERFTLDEGLTLAVQTAFKKLHDDGLIYRGERIVNWCSDCGTAVSDLEVDHQQTPGKLWTIRYPLTEGSGFIMVATTRPETMLGDTAVAVHPEDSRYQSLIGKTVQLPVVGRSIPIVADSRIDRAFGTGAVKVTPAHDPLDFEIGNEHRLPRIQVIGFDGRMTDKAGPRFTGVPILEARQVILQDLKQSGALIKEEDYIHAVGYCERSKTLIEPLVSRQWFVKTKPLAAKAMAVVRSKKITIVPARFEKVFFHWMENIRDWNISRQIWWGHRLPVWYRASDKQRDEPTVALTSPGPDWVQDPDTLDTWFSSGLWTFSTLGWPASRGEPKNPPDLKRFHPTDVMETGWDILFFWVARMIMLSLYFRNEVPFKTVYLHGLILDEEGKKMSKSKGTGIDPLPVADRYGMDALRMSLIVGNAPGQDFRMYEKKIENYRNFTNKLWNVSRFILAKPRPATAKPATQADRWILYRLNAVTAEATQRIDKFDFSGAGQALYDFVWHEFADWYLEASKVETNPGVLYTVLEQVLHLLHPFMPFVTEAIWQQLDADSMLMIEPWSKERAVWKKFSRDAKQFEAMKTTVVALRNFATHVTGESVVGTYVGDVDQKLLSSLAKLALRHEPRLVVVGGSREITLGTMRFLFPETAVQQYEAWLEKERAGLESYMRGLEQKLSNQNFVQRAKPEVVEQERQKLAEAKQRLLEL